MCGTRWSSLIEFLGVESKTEGSLDAGTKSLCVACDTPNQRTEKKMEFLSRRLTKSKDTSIVNLSLDERSRVEITTSRIRYYSSKSQSLTGLLTP